MVTAGFLSCCMNGFLPYVRHHITILKYINKTYPFSHFTSAYTVFELNYFFLVAIQASGDSTFTCPDLFSLAQVYFHLPGSIFTCPNNIIYLLIIDLKTSVTRRATLVWVFSCQGLSGNLSSNPGYVKGNDMYCHQSA